MSTFFIRPGPLSATLSLPSFTSLPAPKNASKLQQWRFALGAPDLEEMLFEVEKLNVAER